MSLLFLCRIYLEIDPFNHVADRRKNHDVESGGGFPAEVEAMPEFRGRHISSACQVYSMNSNSIATQNDC